MAPCRYFVSRSFGGTHRLHLQNRSNPRTMNQREQVALEALDWVIANTPSWFIVRGLLLPWRWRRYVFPKRRLTKYLHGATSQKTVFFIVIAVKTSNLTFTNVACAPLLITAPQPVAPLSCILEVPGWNPGRNTDYPDMLFVVLISPPPLANSG
jgi:hypothetical protein